MILPRGTPAGVLIGPVTEESAMLLRTFSGLIHVLTGDGIGMLLTEQGKLLAACFKGELGLVRGTDAFEKMNRPPGFFGGRGQELTLFRYNAVEFKEAMEASALNGLLLPERMQVQLALFPPRLDEGRLKIILKQPGVIAVSAFFEGFPVQSYGNADFEQVAAMAEDLLRAGMKMIASMNLGQIEEMLLETTKGKFIIAPFKDLFLCLYTTPDTNLGLIRLAIHRLQQEEQ